jgi:tRNA/rRNA methyltransferase
MVCRAESALGRSCVVLVRTRNPLNIGAAARAMTNFGFSDLRLVDAFTPSLEEARSAVGAAELLKTARTFTSIAEAVADCNFVVGTTAGRNRELRQALQDLPSAAPLILQKLASGKVALLFGSEKTGLKNEELSYCHQLLRIPTVDTNVSMNLGQAVAVCLYQLSILEQPAAPTVENSHLPSTEQLERISHVLLEVLAKSDFTQPHTQTATEDKVRRLLRRMQLSSEDAELWLGMLRQIQWRIRQS